MYNKKICETLLESPNITALVAAFDAKAFNDTGSLKSYLAGGNKINNFHRQNKPKMPRLKYLTKHMAYIFLKFHICFFLSVLIKTKHTANMGGGMKTLKHKASTMFQLAYHGCKNLTYKSKTHQVKCTQVVATARITIHMCVIFSESNANNCRAKGCEV